MSHAKTCSCGVAYSFDEFSALPDHRIVLDKCVGCLCEYGTCPRCNSTMVILAEGECADCIDGIDMVSGARCPCGRGPDDLNRDIQWEECYA